VSDQGYVFEWPLWGLRVDAATEEGEPRVRIGSTLVYQPTWTEWEATEHGDIVREYAGRELAAEQVGLPFFANPPACMLRLSEMDGTGDPDPTLERHEVQMRALVMALRLHAPGDFIDPGETGTYITLPDGLTHRRVHAFRAAFYQEQFQDPYVIAADDVDALEGIAHWVQVLHEDPAHTNAVIALENLCLSFGVATSSGERALHGFVALEAMLGSVHGRVAGVPFADRAANGVQGDDGDVRAWLDRAGDLRNQVAHDLESVELSEQNLRMLGDVTRGVLLSYLLHVSQGGVQEQATRPLRSFNQALAVGAIEEVE
jgi:hypothetical protein